MEAVHSYNRLNRVSSNHSVNHVPPRIGGGGGSTKPFRTINVFCFYERIVQRLYPNLLRVQPAYKPIEHSVHHKSSITDGFTKVNNFFQTHNIRTPRPLFALFVKVYIYTHLILSFLSVWGSGSWLCECFLLYPL